MKVTQEQIAIVIVLLRLIMVIVSWILFSLGLFGVLRKLKRKHRWMAWVPALRYVAFGAAVDRPFEGVLIGVLELLSYAASFYPEPDDPKMSLLRSLILLVLLLTLFIYRIRLFLRLIDVFRARTRWIALWIFAEALTMLIFGYSKKLQPKSLESLDEEAHRAAAQPVGDRSALSRKERAQSGLSVCLRARTVSDFGRKRYLLKDIDVEIPNGSLVMLLGGSGAGKTTFINAVIGYEKADATVLLNGANVYEDYQNLKYRIGFVPQQNLMRGNDTVMRTVSDAAKLRLPRATRRKERVAKINEVLEELGLSAGKNGLVSKKSGGQLRRIAIAQELVSDPELFVLDEPDSGLDGAIAHEIFTKLREIADTGKIVIVITHTPDRVADLFDRVIVLAKDANRVGRLAFYGTPNEARAFFERDTMEQIVVAVNRTEEGGEGLADQFIERYAAMTAEQEGGDAQ